MHSPNSSRIQPELKTRDLTFIVIGLVIGMGIFRTPAEVAVKAGLPWIFFLAWTTGAFVSFIGAMTFAEIGSRLPAAGGFYKIFSVCYSPVFAFMVNWIMVISNAVSTAAVAIMGAEYMAPLVFPGYEAETGIRIVSVLSLVFLYGINMFGIKVSSVTINFLMILKLSLLALIISIPFFIDDSIAVSNSYETNNESSWIHAFLLCFVPVFFTYGGYQQTMNFGGDVKNPRKSIPKAIGIGILVVMLIYLAVNISYVNVLGFEKLKHSTTLASDMMSVLFGNAIHKIVSVLMFFSVMAFVNVSLISNPRVYFAMAEDKVMPAIFMKVNPRTQVQEYGVTFFCLVMLVVLLFLASFTKMLGFVMFFDSISIIAGAAAIFILRNKRGNLPGNAKIFRMRGYPVLPLLFIIIYLGVALGVMLAEPEIFGVGVVLFLVGYPLYHFVRYRIQKTPMK